MDRRAAVTAPPTFAVKVTGQTTNAASAEALNHIVTFGLAELSGVPPTISPDLAKLLTPTVSNDQLVITGDTDKLTVIAKELAAEVRGTAQACGDNAGAEHRAATADGLRHVCQ